MRNSTPATLLAKPLPHSCNHDKRCLGMKLTHLMAAMVPLCNTQVSTTQLSLTRRWRNSTSSRPSSATTCTSLLPLIFCKKALTTNHTFILLIFLIFYFNQAGSPDLSNGHLAPISALDLHNELWQLWRRREEDAGARKRLEPCLWEHGEWMREFIWSQKGRKRRGKGVDHNLQFVGCLLC